jgi:lipoate-protein ligase A
MPNDRNEPLWPTSLRCYDLTLSTTAENLALDEALLSAVEADPSAACLRFWQSADYVVVLGRSNKPETEVVIDDCVVRGIPIFRRMSGGGTVIVGPGCLCYSLILPIDDLHRSLGISGVTSKLMTRTAAGLHISHSLIQVCGTSDLTVNGMKFSGNAQRWLKHSFIHHGTILFDFDLTMMERCLPHPTREPTYRNSRRHDEFVTNLAVNSVDLRNWLQASWNAVPAVCPTAILEMASRIAVSRYDSIEWTISPAT